MTGEYDLDRTMRRLRVARDNLLRTEFGGMSAAEILGYMVENQGNRDGKRAEDYVTRLAPPSLQQGLVDEAERLEAEQLEG
jgi:hypothetical protein